MPGTKFAQDCLAYDQPPLEQGVDEAARNFLRRTGHVNHCEIRGRRPRKVPARRDVQARREEERPTKQQAAAFDESLESSLHARKQQ